MCVYKRTLFALCNHHQWLPQPFRICEHQQSYLAGQTPEPCKQARGHPLATVKLEKLCPRCEGSHQTVNEKLQKAKDMISESKKTLVGADERCRAILEDVGIDMSESEDEGEVEGLKEEMEALGGIGGLDTASAKFLKRRKEDDKKHLFMG